MKNNFSVIKIKVDSHFLKIEIELDLNSIQLREGRAWYLGTTV